jgi:hypothetical protein
MADIVLTIPKSEYGNDDLETKAYNEIDDSFQFWTLSRTPTRLNVGDRVYFVKHNRIDSSMRLFDIQENVEQHCDVTGRTWTGKCMLYLDDLKNFEEEVETKGFQGFRYKWW